MSRQDVQSSPRHATVPNATNIHVQRKQPETLRSSGLHNVCVGAAVFGRINTVASNKIGPASAASAKKPIPWGNATTPRNYDGAELGPSTARPGAMQALTKPSRVGKQLFYRDGRVEAVP